MTNNNKKMIVFDVNGIILNTQMGAFKDILVILGKEKEVRILDEEYQRRKEKGPWGMEKVAELYQGFSEDELRKVTEKYCQENLKEGVKECINFLKQKGYIVGAISGNPQFVLDWLKEKFSLDFAEGTILEFKNKRATGKILRKLDRYGKAEILKEKINNYHINKENVVVIGNSISDLPMAEVSGVFIVFQPRDEATKQRASKIVESFEELKDI